MQRAKAHFDELLRGLVPPASAKPAAKTRYRLASVYHTFTDQGTPANQPQTVSGEFVFSSADCKVRWIEATSYSNGSAVVPQDFMQGLTYTRANRLSVFSVEFMKRFPEHSEKERNLVWDQVMFDSFLDYVDKLKLNEPIKGPAGTVQLGVGGKFDNSNIELIWAGITRRNNEDCLLIRYEGFMNRFEITTGNVVVKARSDYWGDMSVSVGTREIEAATLLEEVAGAVQLGQQRVPLLIFRRAILEPIR
jgi:hypothetical protein